MNIHILIGWLCDCPEHVRIISVRMSSLLVVAHNILISWLYITPQYLFDNMPDTYYRKYRGERGHHERYPKAAENLVLPYRFAKFGCLVVEGMAGGTSIDMLTCNLQSLSQLLIVEKAHATEHLEGRKEGNLFFKCVSGSAKVCIDAARYILVERDLLLSGNLRPPFSHHAQNSVAEGAQFTKATTAMVAAQMMEVLAGAGAAATTVEVQVFAATLRSRWRCVYTYIYYIYIFFIYMSYTFHIPFNLLYIHTLLLCVYVFHGGTPSYGLSHSH